MKRETVAEPFGGDLATPAGRHAFVDAVLSRSTSADSLLHGPEHWMRVALAGARIAQETPGADPLVVFMFAVLHDCARVHDAEDIWHGWRAAKLARAMLAGSLPGEGLEKLAYALEEHDTGKVSGDPTIGACWDADRLNLWRLWETRQPRLLSTQAARNPESIEWARELQAKSFSWSEVVALYEDSEQSPVGKGGVE